MQTEIQEAAQIVIVDSLGPVGPMWSRTVVARAHRNKTRQRAREKHTKSLSEQKQKKEKFEKKRIERAVQEEMKVGLNFGRL